MARSNRTEHGEAAALFDYVRINEIRVPELQLFHAIPNGAKLSWTRDKNGLRYSNEARRLKVEGLRSGVPDYFLPAPRSGYYGLYLELKTNKYMPSLDQIFFLLFTRSLGYRSTCCWEADTAIEVLDAYINASEVWTRSSPVVNNKIFYNVPETWRSKLRELIDDAVREYEIPASVYNPNVTLID